jgi:P-type Cu2+ transporter
MEPAKLPPDAGSVRTAITPFVQTDAQGLQHLMLAVDGIHCHNCIGRIERTLVADTSVREARLNFSTRRLSLIWQGAREQAEGFVQQIESMGYKVQAFEPKKAASAQHDEEKHLLLCTAVAGFASGNIMLLSFALWSTSGAEMGEGLRALMHWIGALIAIPTAIFSGRPFFKSAFNALRHGRTNMDVPISVGVVLTLGISVFQTLRLAEHAYFDAVVMLLFFLLIGRYLDHRARAHARAAATDLLALMSGTATILRGGKPVVLPISELRPGMLVQLALGERVPADGVLKTGPTSLDASVLTGETLPQTAQVGQLVPSGLLNVGAPVLLEVSKPAENSLLADIVRLMERAEQAQAKYVRLADRAARLYTPVVHTLAALAFIYWYFWAGATGPDSLMIAATVLIITCPCALGLVVPVVQVLATGLLLKRGVMVKAGDAFERLAAIDTLLLDKTGTLTRGQPELVGMPDSVVLRKAASLAVHSRHPLAQALTRAYAGPYDDVQVTEHPGEGLSTGCYKLGSRSFIGVAGGQDSQLELWFGDGSTPPTRFVFADALRSDAADALAKLSQLGLKLQLLSGDRPEVVAEIAKGLPLELAEGTLKPADKLARLQQLHTQGRKVGMMGDGLNDAPVLAAADVSLAPSSALEIAQNAADIVFTGEKLGPVVFALRVARFSQRLVKENFALAILYNAIAIPYAFLGHVTPLGAAIAMSLSSIIVIANSFRLKGMRP